MKHSNVSCVLKCPFIVIHRASLVYGGKGNSNPGYATNRSRRIAGCHNGMNPNFERVLEIIKSLSSEMVLNANVDPNQYETSKCTLLNSLYCLITKF